MADISLNEVASSPADTLDMAYEISVLDLGFNTQDPVFSIFPEGFEQEVNFGFPSLAIPGAGIVSPDGISEKVLFGEPWLTPKDRVYPEGIQERVTFGEPFLSTPPASPVDPTIMNVVPVGSGIGTQTPWQAQLNLDPLNGTIERIIILATYPSGVSEVVYLNGAFTPDYSGASVLFEFHPGLFVITLIRNGGWPSSPRIFLHANTDRGGMTES